MADTTDQKIDTGNYQMVSINGDTVVVLFPKYEMTREQALLHAAWLVSTANPSPGEFEGVLTAVQNS
jgi:hypothetical protein